MFRCDVSGRPPALGAMLSRLKATVRGYGSPFQTRIRFGFRALNFRIAHAEVWDSVFPLLFLTRNGGPLFNRDVDAAVIRFRYPTAERARAFFVQRAADMGLAICVEGDTVDRTWDIPGRGVVQAFGGGKESRLLHGILQETGRAPRPMTAGAANAPRDLPTALVSEPLWGSLAECVMPALMAGAAAVYVGASLSEVQLHRPWTQHYDLSSPSALGELTALLRSLGVECQVQAPLAVLPSNLVQRTLADRYPALAQHQRSVPEGRATEKNLHVALLKLHHGLPIEPQCPPDLFQRLVRGFLDRRHARPESFGFRNHREVFNREMMAILARHMSHPLLARVRDRIDAGWDARWIDGVHRYVNPALDPSIDSVLTEHAPEYVPRHGEFRVDQVPDGGGVTRVYGPGFPAT